MAASDKMLTTPRSDLPRLNFIGCGRAGQVLGRLWHQHKVFQIGAVLTRSSASADLAVNRMGTGQALEHWSQMHPADIFLLATTDQSLQQSASLLAAQGLVTEHSVVFHLSGALDAGLLRKAGLDGQHASIHPLRSFGEFDQSVAYFPGTWCGYEGDTKCQEMLQKAFSAIGGKQFSIDPGQKLVYHAASVTVSNYLNGLTAAALEMYRHAGISSEVAQHLIEPIMRNTLQNIQQQGPVAALTGPISRGDWRVVAAELERLQALDPMLGQLYLVLGQATLKLAKEQNLLNEQQLVQLEKVLS